MRHWRAVTVLAALLSACGTPTTTTETGSVRLDLLGLAASATTNPASLVNGRKALDSTHTEAPVLGPITQVVISVVGPAGTPYAAPGQKIVVDSQFDSISRTFNGLPVGRYTFSASAYGVSVDPASPAPLLFSGSADYTVVANTMGTILLILHQVPAPGTVNGVGPLVRSVTIGTGTGPVVGSTISLSAEVGATNDPLTYQWSSTCNGTLQPVVPGGTPVSDSFSSPTTLSTAFTSYCLGTETFTFSVTDHAVETGSITAVAQFSLNYAPQGGRLEIAYDVFPDILQIGIASPGLIPHFSQSAELAAVVETHGADVTYAWSDDCNGTFVSGATTPTPTWRAPPTTATGASSPITCTLTLRVAEIAPRVGTNTGTLTLQITDGRALGATGTVEVFDTPLDSRPNRITVGHDGNLWFTDVNPSGHKIGRMTPTGEVTQFALSPGTTGTYDITAGPDGNVWFTTSQYIGRITPEGIITEFPDLKADSLPRGITAGPDGVLWFTDYLRSEIGRITPDGVFREYSTATIPSLPYGITSGPDGNVWFTEFQGNKIGRIAPDGEITEFELARMPGDPVSRPFDITAGPDGYLWFTESALKRIGRITPEGTIVGFSIQPTPGSNPSPYGIAAGPDGNLWFTEYLSNKIGRITPRGTITEFTAGQKPYCITAGPDGYLWFTMQNSNAIGRITP